MCTNANCNVRRKRDMILLNKEDIKKVFTMKDAIEANKKCYKQFNEGKFDVPLRTIINGVDGDFVFMPSYCAEDKSACVKVVNVMPGNKAKGLPGSIGQVFFIDGETGEVKALLDGTYITSLRTAAASGAAFDLFGLENASVGAVIGTGSQALHQIEAILAARPVKEVRVAARNFEKTKEFVEDAKKELAAYGAEIIACEDTNAAVDGADLVVLVTTAATPVCSAEYFKPGCVISAVGAYQYDMQELDPAVFAKCGKVYCDSCDAVLAESGDIRRPLEDGSLKMEQITGDIGDCILGRISGRESDDEIIVFENVGMGALDLVAADEICRKAEETGLGTRWE